ncbi:MAG: hypothetical protein ACKVHO_00145 [Verrucomicrobiia bacterium]
MNVNTTPRIRVGQILPERNAKVSINTRVSGDQLGGAGTVVPSFTKDVISTKDTFFKRASTGILRVPKIGGTQGKLRTSALLGPTYRLPLFTWEGAPDDAELKIGRFYLDILTLSGTVLYSDNTEQEEEKTRGVLSATGSVIEMSCRPPSQVLCRRIPGSPLDTFTTIFGSTV